MVPDRPVKRTDPKDGEEEADATPLLIRFASIMDVGSCWGCVRKEDRSICDVVSSQPEAADCLRAESGASERSSEIFGAAPAEPGCVPSSSVSWAGVAPDSVPISMIELSRGACDRVGGRGGEAE